MLIFPAVSCNTFPAGIFFANLIPFPAENAGILPVYWVRTKYVGTPKSFNPSVSCHTFSQKLDSSAAAILHQKNKEIKNAENK